MHGMNDYTTFARKPLSLLFLSMITGFVLLFNDTTHSSFLFCPSCFPFSSREETKNTSRGSR